MVRTFQTFPAVFAPHNKRFQRSRGGVLVGHSCLEIHMKRALEFFFLGAMIFLSGCGSV